MNITEVKILFPYTVREEDKLKAFASIVIDNCFLISHLKVILGQKGLFVAMPSRKLTDHCPSCHYQNNLQAKFCNQCSVKLAENRVTSDEWGRLKLREDTAHPISSSARRYVEDVVLKAYYEELDKQDQDDTVVSVK